MCKRGNFPARSGFHPADSQKACNLLASGLAVQLLITVER